MFTCKSIISGISEATAYVGTVLVVAALTGQALVQTGAISSLIV